MRQPALRNRNTGLQGFVRSRAWGHDLYRDPTGLGISFRKKATNWPSARTVMSSASVRVWEVRR